MHTNHDLVDDRLGLTPSSLRLLGLTPCQYELTITIAGPHTLHNTNYDVRKGELRVKVGTTLF